MTRAQLLPSNLSVIQRQSCPDWSSWLTRLSHFNLLMTRGIFSLSPHSMFVFIICYMVYDYRFKVVVAVFKADLVFCYYSTFTTIIPFKSGRSIFKGRTHITILPYKVDKSWFKVAVIIHSYRTSTTIIWLINLYLR